MDNEAWQATIHGVTKELDMTFRLNNKQQQKIILASNIYSYNSAQLKV